MFSCEQVDHYEVIAGALHKSRTDYDVVSSNLVLSVEDYREAIETYHGYVHDLRYQFACEVDGSCCGLRGMRNDGYYVELQAITADDECYLICRDEYVYDDYVRDYA